MSVDKTGLKPLKFMGLTLMGELDDKCILKILKFHIDVLFPRESVIH